MSDHSITSLIEKLEGADPNDAWVFARDVHLALFGGSLGKAARCPKYTTSLDAALALAERVLPGVWWIAGRGKLRASEAEYGAQLMFGEEPIGQGEGATAALALCAAILRAQSEDRV